MGLGERKKRGGRFGRRGNRRIKDTEPGFGVRRRSRSSSSGFLCCCGALTDPCERNQEDILALHQAQEQILSFKQQPDLDRENPVWHASHDQERREQVEELQNEQTELFNDIVEQYYNEKDEDKVQKLFTQQCELVEQMQELQAAGYAYSRGIPSAIDVSKRKYESVDTTSADLT